MRKYSRKRNLVFMDLAILWLVGSNPQDPPSQRDLWDGPRSYNRWLDQQGVPVPLITNYLTGKSQLPASMNKLSRLGYMVRLTEHPNASMIITPKGRALLRRLGKDWRNWYINLPLKNGEVQFHQGETVQRILEAVK